LDRLVGTKKARRSVVFYNQTILISIAISLQTYKQRKATGFAGRFCIYYMRRNPLPLAMGS